MIGERSDATTRVHTGATATDSLAGSLDLQVYEVFNAMSAALKGVHNKEAEEAKLRLDGVRDVTSHLIQEMTKQQTEMSSMVTLMKHLKDSVNELAGDASRFSSQVKALHSTIAVLKDSSERQSSTHNQVHDGLVGYHKGLMTANKSSGAPVLILFFVVQLLLVAGVAAALRLNLAPKKMSRMV